MSFISTPSLLPLCFVLRAPYYPFHAHHVGVLCQHLEGTNNLLSKSCGPAKVIVGIKIVHQNPPGCIVPQEGSDNPQLFNFEAVSEFVIPRQAFCNRYITVRDPGGEYRILGYPVCVKDEKYSRNEFIFNFGIVTSTKHDMIPYEAVVRRLATTFTEMEIQTEFLSQEGSAEGEGRRSIGALLEIIREDLNNYNECMIPVGKFCFFYTPGAGLTSTDASNTINMKLFPVQLAPPPVKSWHVPIAKIRFDDFVDDRWDLTMRKVIPEIDGISDVRRIAQKADVSLDLTKLALQHLLYYKTIILVDMLFFSNIYAVTPLVDDFINNVDNMQEECAAYVFTNRPKAVGYYLCRLLTSFCQGRTLKEWLKMHMDDGFDVMNVLDVRKLVQFGVIKGILRRIHKFPVSSQYLGGLATGQTADQSMDEGLQKYTDGCHSFDQIITENHITEAEVTKKLSKLPPGDVQILYR